MDEHEDRERASRVVGRDVEAVHALAVRVLEVPRLERACCGSEPSERQEFRPRVVHDEPPTRSLLVEEPDPPVGADPRLPDVAGVGLDGDELAARDVVAVEARAALVQVLQEERRPVGPPVRSGDLALEVERE